ncbi:MAG: NAD(P)H-dependent oxidoreductase [Clostridiales bacterium]|jgi:multimeric flavodoxin WrbA|nr:NAD(P)H-dependent oxidoreductase [Clostridiales bacterium]
MKVAIINGSPKLRESASQLLAEAVQKKLGNQTECAICSPIGPEGSEILKKIEGANALVFVFPLYIDGLPSHLLRFLDESLQDISDKASGAMVYSIVNNGFFEGRQNAVAFEIMRNFADKAGLKWGQGIGVGGGGMLRSVGIGRGPLKKVGNTLDLLSKNIINARSAQNYTVDPDFPRALYIAVAHLSWRASARKNKVNSKQMLVKP